MTSCNYWKGAVQCVPFTQIFVSYKSVQYKRSIFAFLFNQSLNGIKIKMDVTPAYIGCARGKWSLARKLTKSFLLVYRYHSFAMTIQLALYEQSIELLASLLSYVCIRGLLCPCIMNTCLPLASRT